MNGTHVLLVAGPLDPAVSYEYHNFQQPMEQVAKKVSAFDFVAKIRALGREAMNQELLAVVKRERPDVVIFVPHTDQFIPDVIHEINTYTVTLGYFYDDMWRIEYSRFWARHFSFITTSAINGVNNHRDAGVMNVIYSPFACNHRFYIRKPLPKRYDVTFVGGYHPYREWYLNRMKRAGIEVRAWGQGWPSGILRSQDMVDTFNQSRINLNLSNSFSWDARYLLTIFRPLKRTLQVWRGIVRAVSQPDQKVIEQVKGRHFEINACGGFQLSYYVEGLDSHYALGKEIALYGSVDDMIDKVRYYLKHDEEREAIARQGYERTVREHTMELRLSAIFEEMGIQSWVKK